MTKTLTELANLISAVDDTLRFSYKKNEYGKIILPFVLLRRLDCVRERAALDLSAGRKECEQKGARARTISLADERRRASCTVDSFNFSGLLNDSKNLRVNLESYINTFSEEIREIFDIFEFSRWVSDLDRKDLLFRLVGQFASVDLHPDAVRNETMGLIFEDLIRRFAEGSSETSGEHYTPPEVTFLIIQCLFAADGEVAAKPDIVHSLYDPAAGTGGMLSAGEAAIKSVNPGAKVELFAQELNPQSYALCKADMLLRGHDPRKVALGDTLTADAFAGKTFEYCVANPPFGVNWKNVEKIIRRDHDSLGFRGRFGPGLPRVSDGSMLFLLHLISKMRPVAEGGGRIGVVLSGSPLFTGDAGSGESEIRRWILENDLLEAIIALPNDLFYNTGIATYVWLLSNRKTEKRRGKVQLIDATRMYARMKRSLGNKRAHITDEQIAEIVRVYSAFQADATFSCEYKEPAKATGDTPTQPEPPRIVSKIFPTTFFGYRKVTVDRPPQPGEEVKVKLKKGQKPYDPDLRDTESIPLGEDIATYMQREVLPHVPDAFVNEDIRDEKDGQVGQVGYEINFNRYFYVYKPPRPPEVIAAEIKAMEVKFLDMLKGIIG